MTVTVRPVTCEDRAAVVAMLREFMDYLDAIEPEAVSDAHIEHLADLVLGPEPICRAIIAERGGAPVGYLAYYMGVWEIDTALYVASLFVREGAREAGVGRALMEEARRVARERGAKRVAWPVWRRNAAAIAFYERLGARVFEEDVLMTWAVGGAGG